MFYLCSKWKLGSRLLVTAITFPANAAACFSANTDNFVTHEENNRIPNPNP